MICSKCSKEFNSAQPRAVNVAEHPELKAKIQDGTFFLHKCPYCASLELDNEDFLYHDPEAHLLIALSSRDLSSDGLEGYTCRLVSSVGDLLEKLKIFEAGLDDIAIEICKFVTMQDLGKDLQLRFYKMEGSDGEIILAYPEKGKMQMLEIGQRVYSDAVGILERTPELSRAASGLVKVDQNWLCGFFK